MHKPQPHDTQEPRLLLSVTEVAHILGIGRTKVYDLIRSSRLPTVHLGRALRVYKPSLLEWVKHQEESA